MTIDFVNFEMTLEVLGDGEEANEFFRSYEVETGKDMRMLGEHLLSNDWNGMKRICHTWKGRNSQIGFRKSSLLAASLHDFVQQTIGTIVSKEGDRVVSEVVVGQIEMFLVAMEREREVIKEFLKSQYLL